MTQDELQQQLRNELQEQLESAANELLNAKMYLLGRYLTKQELINSDTLKTAIKLRHKAQKLGLFDDLCAQINDYYTDIHNFEG